MIEIPDADGVGKIVVSGADLATFKLELDSGEDVRMLLGLTEEQVKRMHDCALNAGKGFPEEIDGAGGLFDHDPIHLSFATEEISFASESHYREIRNGEVVVELRESQATSLKKPIMLFYLNDLSAEATFTLGIDCFMMTELAKALKAFLP